MNVDPPIRVRCPECEMVDVPATEITVRHCADDDSWDYWFECPTCRGRASGRSNSWPALEAFAVGSALEVWHLPAELNEPHDGPPLGLLDLVALQRALARPDWFDELLRTPGPTES
jgi:hypothetical protein